MNTGFQMFLLAAEEMNFSRAADRAFVTQQCLSDHIKRLEDSYQVTLFKRRPHLELTPEGEAMLRYLEKIQFLEENMKNELEDIKTGTSGTITFGISTTRGYIMVPDFIPKFQKDFPKVNVRVVLNDTRELEKLLLTRKLDMFIGVNTSSHVLFYEEPVGQEQIYLVVSRATVERHREQFGDSFSDSQNKGVDLKNLTDIPFVSSYMSSTTAFAVQQHLMRNHIHLKTPITVSNFDILLDLCQKGGYATFAPAGHLYQVIRMNCVLLPEERIMIFPIRGFTQKMSIALVRHREAQRLSFMDEFSSRLVAYLKEQQEFVEAYIQSGRQP